MPSRMSDNWRTFVSRTTWAAHPASATEAAIGRPHLPDSRLFIGTRLDLRLDRRLGRHLGRSHNKAYLADRASFVCERDAR